MISILGQTGRGIVSELCGQGPTRLAHQHERAQVPEVLPTLSLVEGEGTRHPRGSRRRDQDPDRTLSDIFARVLPENPTVFGSG